MSNYQVFFFLLLLVADLAVTAARSGLLSIRYTKLESLGEELNLEEVEATIALITQRTKLRAAFKLSQFGLRFLMAGVVLSVYIPQEQLGASSQNITLTLILIAFVLWLIEFFVELLILRNPDLWAIRFTPMANFILKMLYPLLAIPLRMAHSQEITQSLITITEGELKSLVDASEEAGQIEKDESQMIHSVIQLADTTAREIMIPRVDMLTLDVQTPLDEAASVLLESGFSRVPVYEGQTDNVIGLLYTKDMLKVWHSGNQVTSLKDLLREADFIPESKKVDQLLDEMQAARRHIAIVVDEYGGVAGLVTLEDIIEEIFGEIKDEYDEGEEELFEKLSPGEYIFHGRVFLDEVNEIMETNLTSKDTDTLSGLIYAHFSGVPEEGETLQQNDLKLTVEKISGRRIQKVRVQRAPSSPRKEDSNDH